MLTRYFRSPSANKGVTLLEIMLVLAIAAMVIVMSIRYYRTASNSQNANAILSLVQAISASAEKLHQGLSSYADVTTAQVARDVTGSATGSLSTPYGATVTISNTSATSYTVNLGSSIPTAVCSTITSQLASNAQITISSDCSSYVYTSNQ